MNDFSELENELKKLRPAQPSPILFERVEEALMDCRASVSDAGPMAKWRWRFTEKPYNWLSLGFGLAAVAVLILLAAISMERRQEQGEKTAQISPAPETKPLSPARLDGSRVQGSTSSNRFIPAGATQVVYNTRDEGLQFAPGSEQPLRRLRYQTHQTWQWRNPTTGASLLVSYPSEEVVLIPVSGQ
jgi:hypothetical protein